MRRIQTYLIKVFHRQVKPFVPSIYVTLSKYEKRTGWLTSVCPQFVVDSKNCSHSSSRSNLSRSVHGFLLFTSGGGPGRLGNPGGCGGGVVWSPAGR